MPRHWTRARFKPVAPPSSSQQEGDLTGSLIHRGARRGSCSSSQVHPHGGCSESASSAFHHRRVCFGARGKVSSPLARSWPRREKDSAGFVHRNILALARAASPSDDRTAGNQMRDGGDMDDDAAAVGNGVFFLPPTVYSVRLERSFCASVSVCFAVTAARLGHEILESCLFDSFLFLFPLLSGSAFAER